jgi:hypothetical protein
MGLDEDEAGQSRDTWSRTPTEGVTAWPIHRPGEGRTLQAGWCLAPPETLLFLSYIAAPAKELAF